LDQWLIDCLHRPPVEARRRGANNGLLGGARNGEVRFLREPLVWTEHGEERSLAAAIVIFGRRACVQWWEIPSVDSTAPPFAATEGGEDHDGTDDESARREPIEAPSASDAELARLRAKFPELGS